jgi:hypothetical protein
VHARCHSSARYPQADVLFPSDTADPVSPSVDKPG